MARTVTHSERLYQLGLYGERVDSFSGAEYLELRLSQVDWPEGVPLMRVQLEWDSGDSVTFDVGGVTKDANGQPRPEVSFRLDVPRGLSGKRDVVFGSAFIEVLVPLRTAITLTVV